VSLRIYTCAEWGAVPRDTRRLGRKQAEGITLHHTAGVNAKVLEDAEKERERCFKLARSIQAHHIGQGWKDSGQHFTVTRSGLILEGRHGTFEAAQRGLVVNGSHAGDNRSNSLTYGIECEGTYTHEAPPAALWAALVALCAHLSLWGGFQAREIQGHREVRKTICPGDVLFRRLDSLRAETKERKMELMLAKGSR
jgi:hypothetical protein